MMELNKIMIVGRLTHKPEIRYLPSGTALAEFDIAFNRRYRSKQDTEQREEAHFFKVKTFGRSAEFAGEWLDKGKAVFIEGRLSQERWENKEGENRSRIVIVADRLQFAESKAAEEGGGGGSYNRDRGSGSGSGGGRSESQDDGPPLSDDSNTENDLPF